VIYLNDASVVMKSRMQPDTSLSVAEAEWKAGTDACVQDMIFMKDVIESVGLKVKLPMLLEMDNKVAVDLVNNWSVSGRTKHLLKRLSYIRGLKEQGLLIVQWVPTGEIEPDTKTKNLAGPVFEKCATSFVGHDEYMAG
jgi:hypothetical protein